MKPDVRGVYRQLATIEKHSMELRASVSRYGGYFYELSSIFREYEDARSGFYVISYREGLGVYLRQLAEPKETDGTPKYVGLLREIEIQCEKGLGLLSSIIVPLSKDEMDKLKSLRDEFEKLSVELKNPYYGPDVMKAIDEYERGDILACVLISSRVIVYALQQVPGKTDEERINFLKEKGIIEKERKDMQQSILKAGHKSRDFFSHDIRLSPTSSDALALLGDTIAILRVIAKLEEDSKS